MNVRRRQDPQPCVTISYGTGGRDARYGRNRCCPAPWNGAPKRTAMAIARGRSSAQDARGSPLHHVLARLQDSSKHHRCSPTPFHGSCPVAVALHRAAAARPRPSDPARARRGRGTRSCVRSEACAPHGSDARTDATAGHLVARLVEMRGAVMPTLRNTFTTIAHEETRPSCVLMTEKEISKPLRLQSYYYLRTLSLHFTDESRVTLSAAHAAAARRGGLSRTSPDCALRCGSPRACSGRRSRRRAHRHDRAGPVQSAVRAFRRGSGPGHR